MIFVDLVDQTKSVLLNRSKNMFFEYKPMDLVVQSMSSEGGAVIAFLHFYRIMSTIFIKLRLHQLWKRNQDGSTS